jgi:type III pantothenate kinase
MLLTVDVGNANTVLGVFRGEELAHSWRLTTTRDATPDEVAVLLGQLLAQSGTGAAGLEGVAVSTVVPPLAAVWQEVGGRFGCPVLLVTPRLDLGVRLEVDRPAEVGSDRIVDALAAWRLYGAPAIVVDCGTATTVDAVAGGGRYLGGAIAPGVGIAAEALFQRAALLYRVELRQPLRVLGTNTESQLQAGIVYGCAGQIDALVEGIRREMGGADHVIATGGFCRLMAPACRSVTAVDPLLTLRGLRLAYLLHRGRGAPPAAPRAAP